MANVSRTVDIIFNADDKVTTAVKNITASLDQLDRMAMKIVDPFAQIGKGIIAADAALTALAVGGMALSIKKSGEFNDAFAEISTLIDASTADLEQYRTQILAYGADSSKSLEDITGALYMAVSGQIDYKDSIDFVREAEKLAIAGRGDLESTTKALVSTMNAYGAAASEAGDYSDVFFQTVKYGLTTLPELADSFAMVTAVAAPAGISFDEVAAAVATLTAAGLPTSKAMTSIRTAISNILKPSGEAAEAAKTLGIQFDAARLRSDGFVAIMQDVFNKVQGNAGAVAELFGNVRGLGSALVIGGDNAGYMATALEGMSNRAGVVGVAFEKMQNNFELVNQRFLNNLDILLVTIGTSLEEGYGKAVNIISQIFQVLTKGINEGSFDVLFNAYDDFIAKLTEFLKGVADVIPETLSRMDFSVITEALSGTSKSIQDLFDLDLTTPEGLYEILQGIVNIIATLIDVTNGMIPVFGSLFTKIYESVESFTALDDKSSSTIGKLLAGAVILQEAGLYLGTALLSMKDSSFKLSDSFEVIHDSLITLYQGAQIIMDTWILSWALFVDTLLSFANTATFGMVDTIKNAKEATDEFVKGGWEDIKERAGVISDAWNETTFAVGSAAKEMTDEVKKVGTQIDESIPDSKIIQTGAAWDTLQAGIVQEQMDATIPKTREVKVKPVTAPDELARIKERLETEAKILEKSLELRAEIDIAQIEADTKRIEAAFESVNVAIESTGDVLSELFGLLAEGDMDFITRWNIEEQIRQENERREESLKLQKELTEAQIAALQARITAFNRGDPLITINAEGLEPHLEAIFFYILEQIQIRVNEEQQDFLLGINP
ncbi:MAG: phage tail tape measure protein [Candidatus Thorarchaeota archaeon]